MLCHWGRCAANGLAVGVGLRLQQLWVCLNAHDISSMAIRASRLEDTWRLKMQAIVPINLLREAVSSFTHVIARHGSTEEDF